MNAIIQFFLSDFAQIFFTISFAVLNVIMALYDNRKNFVFIITIWKRFRFLMLMEVTGLISIFLLFYYGLTTISPIFGYGWFRMFSSGGGNFLITPIMVFFSSDVTMIRCLPIIFLLAFLLSLPFVAKLEEDIFRRGCHTWGKMIYKSTIFGLIHLVIGIPLGAGIALVVPGLFFAYKYKQTFFELSQVFTELKYARNEAVLVSTTYHTMMNTLLISYLMFIVIINI